LRIDGLLFPREVHLLLAQFDITQVHPLRDYLGVVAQLVVHKIGIAVLHLVHAELFGCIGLDVGEFVVVINRLDIEGSFVGVECAIKFELQRVGAVGLSSVSVPSPLRFSALIDGYQLSGECGTHASHFHCPVTTTDESSFVVVCPRSRFFVQLPKA
jgi:hypothetical protein